MINCCLPAFAFSSKHSQLSWKWLHSLQTESLLSPTGMILLFICCLFCFPKKVICLSCAISTGYGECLLDEPVSRPYTLSQQLPGQIYSVNKQCELIFGPGTQVCPYMVRGSLRILHNIQSIKHLQCIICSWKSHTVLILWLCGLLLVRLYNIIPVGS